MKQKGQTMQTHADPIMPVAGGAPQSGRTSGKSLAPFVGRLIVAAAFVIAGITYGWLRAQSGAGVEFALWIAIAAGFGAYMALNIGANDVANNIGPTVGAGVMPLGIALIMAAGFAFLGALIAGGSVTGTVRGGIVAPEAFVDSRTYVWVMMAALLAAALWLNLASSVGAPVSTTHSIVGGVMGGGIAAAGLSVVNWPVVMNIVASWVVSPLLGASLAALFLYVVKRSITYQGDVLDAAARRVPLLVAAMGWSFASYMMLKGVSKIVDVTATQAIAGGGIVAVAIWALMRVIVARRIPALSNCKESVNRLLAVPLIFAAALLSFAHGSNDVANAIGPLAGIYDALTQGGVQSRAAIPIWTLVLGALGLAVGLILFGPKVIRTIGTELTGLDAMRAYCIAMAATITVIIASQLGLPVSTTHVTVGAVLGVGFLREWIKTSHARALAEIRAHHGADDTAAVEAFIARFVATPLAGRKAMLDDLKARNKAGIPAALSRRDRKSLNRAHKRDLVNRGLMVRIFAAWVITVPATALMSGLIYFTLRGMLL
jgi:PiT family inorganic phosphate transporter